MNKIQQFFSWLSKQNIVVKIIVGFSLLIIFCCFCSMVTSIFSPSTPSDVNDETTVERSDSNSLATQSENISATSDTGPTYTAIPTETSAPTSTPAPTETETPTFPPKTQTAIAIANSKTSVAATRFASQTAVASNATATRQVINAQRTQSAAATATYQEKISQYERVNIQDIVSYPGAYEGKKIIVRAEVYDIEGDGQDIVLWLYSYAASDFMQAYPEHALTPQSGVKEGYAYYIYGTVEECFAFYALEGYCLFDIFIPNNK